MIKNYKKITALTLSASFLFCQLAFAVNPRQLLTEAKESFNELEKSRRGYAPAQKLQNSQARQESLIDQKQVLTDLVAGQVAPLPLPVPTPVVPLPDMPQPEGDAVIDSTNDTHFGLQWGIGAIHAEEAWAFNRGEGTVAAIIDTGLDFLHPDIQSNIWLNPGELAGNGIDDDGNGYIDDVRGWDFYNGDNDAADDHGHGTHVAGIVAAAQNNSLGITGVAPQTKIMALKVLNSSGGGILSTIFSAINSAIRYAADEGAKIINMSLGIPPSYYSSAALTAFQNAVQYARNLGSVIVAAAGNNYGAINIYPALFDEVITVGALKSTGGQISKDSYSSTGSDLDFMAPGTGILSLRAKNTNTAYAYPAPNGDYVYFSGTSMATPHVVGTISLLLAEDPFLSFDDIYRRLKFSSADLGTTGYDTFNGYGLINAFKALSYDYYDTGNAKKQFFPDGSYTTFDEYWPGTGIVKLEHVYDANGVLVATNRYDQSGNLIVDQAPVLVTSLNAQNYASASGTVYNYSPDILVLYGNRSVNYTLNIANAGEFSLKFSTAQVTSKDAPPGYLFHFNIKIDGVTVASVDLNSSRTFTPSDFIDLGSLSAGAHTLTLQWTNDTKPTPYDANVGIRGLELYA